MTKALRMARVPDGGCCEGGFVTDGLLFTVTFILYRIALFCRCSGLKVVTVRVPEKCFRDLEQIEKEEKAERAQVVRKLLAAAIKQWKLKKASQLLADHKVTLRKAAEMAEVSYLEMLDLAADTGIDIGYSLSELERDLERI